MKRIYIVLLLAALAVCLGSCRSEVALPDPGVLYEISLRDTLPSGSRAGVARFDRSSDGSLTGIFYVDKGQLYAEAEPVTVKAGRSVCQLELPDGTCHSFRFKPCSVPAFQEPSAAPLYRDPIYPVTVEKDVIYGNEKGYWTSYPREPGLGFAQVYLNRLGKVADGGEDCALTLDVYQPEGSGVKARPLFVLIHGGAFYYQDKADPECEAWCRHFASLGYVAASVNYRMGFLPSREETTRAGYRALQDVHAAVRHLVGDDHLNVDPQRVFLAGSSAGAITALNLAFMQSDARPDRTKGGLITGWINKQFGTAIRDMGPVDAVNPEDSTVFSVRAVCNMWGAVPNLEMLANARVPIVSFHSENDPTVPFGYDYPFRDYFQEELLNSVSGGSWLKKVTDWLSVTEKVSKVVFNKMYGSQFIDQRARSLGYHSQLYRYDESKHCLYLDDSDSIIPSRLNEIIGRTEAFFSQEMEPNPVNTRLTSREGPWIGFDRTAVNQIFWQMEGGVIREMTPDSIRVLVFPDAPVSKVTVTGTYQTGMTFREEMNL